jgi:hypothetical protein
MSASRRVVYIPRNLAPTFCFLFAPKHQTSVLLQEIGITIITGVLGAFRPVSEHSPGSLSRSLTLRTAQTDPLLLVPVSMRAIHAALPLRLYGDLR